MSEENLFEMIKLLGGEVRHLRKLLHFQGAQIQGLRVYAVARIADLKSQDRRAAFAEIEKIVREVYDKHISKIEAESPTVAADIDMRDTMTPQEQEMWYLLDKYLPPKDTPPSGESSQS
jgi:hypothetical protein